MKAIVSQLVVLIALASGACSAGMGSMGGCGMGHGSHGGSSHEAHEQVADATVQVDGKFDPVKMLAVLDAYQTIVMALASDQVNGVAEAAKVIAVNGPTGTIRESASGLSQAAKKGDLAGSRERFKGLTGPMVAYVESNHHAVAAALSSEGRPVPDKAYCPMADGFWLQTGDKITNPFFGSSMLRCGELQEWAPGH